MLFLCPYVSNNPYLYPVLLTQFSEHIAISFPNLKDKKLLVAISGGLDSVVLTELLHQLKYNIALAHCNFQLRDIESNQDEFFVNAMANRKKLSVFTKVFDTTDYAKKEKLSIQLAARQLRYNWFDSLLQKHNFDYLLTAHHADDNLETFLINFSRGTGIDGLIGIPEQNEKIIRPLLPFSRKKIELFAKSNNLTWREDASNAETKYLRNKLRHEVIPALKEVNPNLLDAFSTTISHLKKTQIIVRQTVESTRQNVVVSNSNGTIELDIKALKKIEHVNAYLYELLKNYNFTAWNTVYDLLDAQSGKFVLSNSHRILKNRNSLIVSPIIDENKKGSLTLDRYQKHIQIENSELNISIVKEYSTLINSSTVFVDGDKLNYPLTIRKWQNGDYFYPFGMQGKKKLSKYFKDEKLSLLEKENTWVLVSDDTIVWIINYRLDKRYKVTPSTKTILKIDFKSS